VNGSASPAAPLGLLTAVAVILVLCASAVAATPAPAPGCTWQRHSKTVVKHLQSHGRALRVKRIKHWWTCEAQPSLIQPQPALPIAPTSAAPPGEEPQAEIGHLGVKAVEYSYTLSRPEVSAGEVIVELNNQGEDPHNLVLEHEGTADPDLEIPSTPSITQASAHFTLSPGTYRLYCSLYKHEAKGMQATLVVSGS
jgi:plastocyanin